MGANPTEAHLHSPALEATLEEGARLIVIDPRRIELVGAPHIKSDFHLPVRPGANVALLNAIAHTIVDEGLVDQEFVDARCGWHSLTG